MHPRIEGLTFGRNALDVELGQQILELLVNQIDAALEFFRVAGVAERQGKIVDHRKQRLGCVGNGVIAEVGIFLGGALAIVIELGLRSGQPVKEVVAFSPQLLQVGFWSLGGTLPRGSFFHEAVARIGSRKLWFLFLTLRWFLNVSLAVSLAHLSLLPCFSDWNFHAVSFNSLSKSCAIYDTAVIVC